MAAPITPYTDPDRFTDDEKRLFDAGKCSHQTAYGLPHVEYCGQPSQPGADFGNCPGHAAAEAQQT